MAAVARHEVERIVGDAMSTSTELRTYPGGTAGAVASTLTAGTPAWTMGSYVEIIAASTIAEEFAILALIWEASGARNYWIELATGAGGSEVVIARVALDVATINHSIVVPFTVPLKIAANARVAARVGSFTASDASGKIRILVSAGTL